MISPVSLVSYSPAVFKVQPVLKVSAANGKESVEKLEQQPTQQLGGLQNGLGRNLDILI